MSAMQRLWELFEKYDAKHAALLREYSERQRLITDVIKEHDSVDDDLFIWDGPDGRKFAVHKDSLRGGHDHADESRPE